MRVSVFAMALILQPTVAGAANFAVACTGTAYAENNLSGPVSKSTDQLPKQVYVIDEDSKTVRRALFPRQQFDKVCPSSKGDPSVDISPGLILVTGPPDFGENSVTCSLELDRQTGHAVFKLSMTFSGERYNNLRWDMICDKAPVPVFTPKKNKF
jgi:hypothetical protein